MALLEAQLLRDDPPLHGLVFLLFSALREPQVAVCRGASERNMGERYALTIGVRTSGRLPRLEGAIADAHAFAEWASAPGRGYIVKLVTDEDDTVTIDRLKGEIKTILNEDISRLLIFYSDTESAVRREIIGFCQTMTATVTKPSICLSPYVTRGGSASARSPSLATPAALH